MPTLRQAMTEFLADWRDDVAYEWRDLLDGVEPAFEDIDITLKTTTGEVIFPGRKGSEPPGAPTGSHVFRALDGLPPKNVRVVVIGQDPYPSVSQATGRSFEQGDLRSWTSETPKPTPSLKRILQQVAAHRTGHKAYAARKGGWGHLRRDLTSGKLDLGRPQDLFDNWQSQGVLMLNAGLTLTRYKQGGHPHQLRGHIPLWAPIVRTICLQLAKQETIPVVFMCWGSKARRFLASANVIVSVDRPVRIANGMSGTAVVDRNHPATVTFLDGPNVIEETNGRLEELGADAVTW